MEDKKWSDLINWNDFYLNKDIVDYESENEEEIFKIIRFKFNRF